MGREMDDAELTEIVPALERRVGEIIACDDLRLHWIAVAQDIAGDVQLLRGNRVVPGLQRQHAIQVLSPASPPAVTIAAVAGEFSPNPRYSRGAVAGGANAPRGMRRADTDVEYLDHARATAAL